MQHVTAFSRPETVPAVQTTIPKKNLWILSSWRDLILYVGTPLLLLPLFLLAQTRWSIQDIYLFVAAFGAVGHHFPGMIRAYGDRALFERFKWRFIFAPIFLLGTCVLFTVWGLKGLVLVIFFWSVWHNMMQTYGFCRIYDAKMGSFAAFTRRLDFATCAVWFVGAVLLSPERMTDTLEAFYSSGGPFIAPTVLQNMQRVALVVAIAVSILFLLNFTWMWVKGKRPNPVKLALLGTSAGFWWFCNNGVTNILAGIALFEVFHDTQYLSLVWIYNRNRVEKDKTIGGFMRFIFRRSGALVGLYIGLVFAYGMLGYVKDNIDMDMVRRVLTGVAGASALLHFYYDGFIWKVRERSTRESLGLTGGTANIGTNFFLPSWALHGLKWAAIFVLPLGALWFGQARTTLSQVDRTAWIVADLPNGKHAHENYGLALQYVGRVDEAAEHFRTALKIDPKMDDVHYDLGHLLLAQSKVDEATQHIEQALRLNPKNGEFHSDYAYLLEQRGEKDAAATEYQASIRLSPKSARVHYNHAMFLGRSGKIEEAIREFQTALKYKPDDADTHYDLGNAFFVKNDWQNAKSQYLATLQLDPNRVSAFNNLGLVFMRQGQISQAIVQFNEALRIRPDDPNAAQNLRLAKAQDARF
jgi:tetratricopeptide (TPR) repeat protein